MAQTLTFLPLCLVLYFSHVHFLQHSISLMTYLSLVIDKSHFYTCHDMIKYCIQKVSMPFPLVSIGFTSLGRVACLLHFYKLLTNSRALKHDREMPLILRRKHEAKSRAK